MAYNQQLSVLGQVAPATTGTAGQVLVSAGSSSSSYWASAIPVSAYSGQFNGTGSYISTPSTVAYSLTGDFTIEAWVYAIDAGRTNDANKYGCLISQGVQGSTTNYWAFYLNIVGGVISTSTIDVAAASPAVTISGLSVSLNTWHHFAWVRSGSTITLYIDGASVGTATYATSLTYNSSGYVTVGHSVSNYGGAYENWIKCFASNIRIVKGLAVYTGAFTPPTSPLSTAQSAGTNIAAVSASQVSLLTCNGPGLIDSSPNAVTITSYSTTMSQFAPFSSFSAISRSATQTQTILTSGSGTYYPPSGVAWLRIRMVGGGGGGAGGGSGGSGAGGFGSAGGSTTFGTSLLTAGGGGGGVSQGTANPAGGTATIGSGATGISLVGASGTASPIAGLYASGASGAASPFGSGGGGGYATSFGGSAAPTNSGAGGGGGGSYTNSGANTGGGGGGAGGYIEAFISSPAASYAYSIGTGGGGGTAASGGFAGGGGGSGIIIVEENYAVNVTGGNYSASYLIVAGGGGGSFGGGGAGGMVTGSSQLTTGTTYQIIVGSGGVSGVNSVGNGTSGNPSALYGIYQALGGGGGGGGTNPSNGTGLTGGSGGGAYSWGAAGVTGASGTAGQGNKGGDSFTTSTNVAGAAGGGGAGAAGSSVANGSDTGGGTGGAGGSGLSSSITGSAVTYAAGGGGYARSGNAVGSTNTGNGGGGPAGSGGAQSGFAGGSGVVILSVPTSNYSGITVGSPTVTTNGNYRILTFTQSGSYTA